MSTRDPNDVSHPAAWELELDATDALVELLAASRLEIEAVGSRSPQNVQIEFGIAALDEVIADHGGEGEGHATDALAALEVSGTTPTADLPLADETAGSVTPATHAHLAIKIVFGEDDQGSGTSI
jgi:hypothetical protein